jgi:K+-transporting ATPase ATPase B chain
VCLIPTTIGGLLSAIGVAGMSRMMQANVIATSGRAVEAAGDVDILLLDKTGTITSATAKRRFFSPHRRCRRRAGGRRAAGVARGRNSEGRSIVVLAKALFNIRERDIQALAATVRAFSAQTRMSGVNFGKPPAPQGRRRCDQAIRC